MEGRIYDPNCGSGTTPAGFVQMENFAEFHGGKLGDSSTHGSESNATTRRLATMNLAVRGIEGLCGQLEARFTANQTESHRLPEALLHHALPA